MGTLKSLPPAVESAEELMAMAYAMEGEAARRYRGLAERMRLRPDARLARLFDFFADLETKHAAQIAERSIAVAGHRVDASRVRWEVPENFDEEAGSSRLLTPYRTLARTTARPERSPRNSPRTRSVMPGCFAANVARPIARRNRCLDGVPSLLCPAR
jgi:hypothetical protein